MTSGGDRTGPGWTFGEPGAPWFTMPRSPAQWGGAAALWVTVAGWAGAARRRFVAESPVLTPAGTLDEAACLDATARGAGAGGGGGRGRRLPAPAKQVVKDARVAAAQRRFRAELVRAQAVAESSPPFVWQHHELFHRAGEAVAAARGVPLVSYVHAPIVWEARRWGVDRRGTGWLLERFAERPSLGASDVVACVSEEVAAELPRFGVDPDRVVVAPMAVDPERFTPDPPDGGAIDGQDRGDRSFRIGWVGSFRKFHALGLLLEAAATLRSSGCDATVVLIGDGYERSALEEQARQLGIAEHVEFAGQVPNPELPAALRRLDAAVVTAQAGQEFHYSPLKLREYMAMALPVVAPAIGEVERLLTPGVDGLVYEPGDVAGLADALGRLAGDAERARTMGRSARDVILATGTWDVMLERVWAALG